jgi:hypothetical protein
MYLYRFRLSSCISIRILSRPSTWTCRQHRACMVSVRRGCPGRSVRCCTSCPPCSTEPIHASRLVAHAVDYSTAWEATSAGAQHLNGPVVPVHRMYAPTRSRNVHRGVLFWPLRPAAAYHQPYSSPSSPDRPPHDFRCFNGFIAGSATGPLGSSSTARRSMHISVRLASEVRLVSLLSASKRFPAHFTEWAFNDWYKLGSAPCRPAP